jgi:predicted dehydrogenase
LLKFPDDRIASFTTSFGATDRSVFEVIGTEGVVKMDPAYEMAEDLKGEITIDGHTTKKAFKKRDQFAPELVYFSDCILNDKEPAPSGQEGLADVRIIRAILEAAEIDRPVSLPQIKIDRRPDLGQEISKEAVAKAPELVRAAAPGAE